MRTFHERKFICGLTENHVLQVLRHASLLARKTVRIVVVHLEILGASHDRVEGWTKNSKEME